MTLFSNKVHILIPDRGPGSAFMIATAMSLSNKITFVTMCHVCESVCVSTECPNKN